MTVGIARVLTYTFVGLFTVIALRMTPPIVGRPDVRFPGGFADASSGSSPTATDTRPVAAPFAVMPAVSAPLTGEIAMDHVVVGARELMIAPVFVLASIVDRIDTVAVTGTIESSLSSALTDAGGTTLSRSARAELAFSLADIFEYRVDMSRDLQVGDKFSVLVERLQKPNGAIIVNKILGARLALSGSEIEAIRFSSREAGGDYFDGSGKSLRASFLRTPVAFRRISSIFGRRRHPVLGVWRRHTGTDYAAAMGTPVRSVGDGVVVFAGRKAGYGNVIDIRHRNGFVSRYGHLRSFSKGTRRGARVGIGKTIGSVGMSGMATGPHLHFEILVNGVQRDPRIALRMKGGEPIPTRERNVFQQLRSRTMGAFGAVGSATSSN
ncbi:MAG: M23 family metallopeptidase [Gemmatimonadaceae bacterium]